MTTKADFSEEDWVRVVRAPFVAGMAITLADPGGPIEATRVDGVDQGGDEPSKS